VRRRERARLTDEQRESRHDSTQESRHDPAQEHRDPTRGPRASKLLERAELFFGCLIFFAGLFYLTREAKTDLQFYFRVVSFLVGAAGWLVVQLLKRGR
jgi:hypothetical protein